MREWGKRRGVHSEYSYPRDTILCGNGEIQRARARRYENKSCWNNVSLNKWDFALTAPSRGPFDWRGSASYFRLEVLSKYDFETVIGEKPCRRDSGSPPDALRSHTGSRPQTGISFFSPLRYASPLRHALYECRCAPRPAIGRPIWRV